MKQMAEAHMLFLFISESYFMSLVKIPIKPWAYQEYMHLEHSMCSLVRSAKVLTPLKVE